MEKDSIENKMKQYYKMSKRVPYSTRIYGDKEKESEPNIILRNIKVKNGRRTSGIKTLLILKYKTLDGIPVEVVLGTINSKYDLINKTEKVINLIEEQLRDNAKEIEGYEAYSKLIEYKKEEEFSIYFTPEGLDILSSKSQKEIQIDKEYNLNDNHMVENLSTAQEHEKRRNDKIPEAVRYQLWREGRQVILRGFTTEKAKETFLKGEDIAKTMRQMEISEKDSPKIVERKNKRKRQFVANYLLDVYDGKITKKIPEVTNQIQNNLEDLKETREKVNNTLNSQEIDQRMRAKLEQLKSLLDDIDNKRKENKIQLRENNEKELLSEYLKIKEKGIAIEINVFLEELEEKLIIQMQKRIDEGEEENYKEDSKIKTLQKYQHFFNFVKKGMDRTARIYAIKEENINFNTLEKVFDRANKEDMMEYIKAKNKMIEETKTDDISGKEHDYSSIRELYKLILNSEPKEFTKDDDNEMFLKIFERAKENLLMNNPKEIELYNFYAKKLSAYECPTYQQQQKDKEDPNNGSR